MSLRHALLGLLAQRPSSGFQLTKIFDESLSRWAWHTTHTHIYPELRRLEEAGLVEVVDRASRGRKTYAVTPAGREEFRRWMMEPPANETVRSEAALRIFLINGLDATEARAMLRDYVDRTSRQLEELHAQLAQAPQEWRDDPLAPGRLAAERGLRTLPAVRDWALWGIDQINRYEERRQAKPSDAPE
jgi:DNA-binding PadR family transcriptional regulator